MDSGSFGSFLTTIASLSLAVLGYVAALEIRQASQRKAEDAIVIRSIFLICAGCIVFALLPLVGLADRAMQVVFITMCGAGAFFFAASLQASLRRSVSVAYPWIYWPLLISTAAFIAAMFTISHDHYDRRIYCILLLWYFFILLFRSWFFVSFLIERAAREPRRVGPLRGPSSAVDSKTKKSSL
ncbi:hypothetical protein [Caulobacter sp.]|uniref:hypothetical protein n=1 Tax=Caulobacter sp. TaxID=78 RepID=UPI003BAC9D23